MVISSLSSVKIQLSPSEQEKLTNKLGIDIGQSLTKIAYFRRGELLLSFFPTKEVFEQVSNLLKVREVNIKHINLTGGKAYEIFKRYNKKFHCQLIDEFKANYTGIEFIYQNYNNNPLPPSLIVTIGTGTSMILKKENVTHIGGTALGGGFFMGIAKLFFDIDNYQIAIGHAKKGNRYNVDLKVSDIYNSEDTRIDDIFREFTASSLGKIDSQTDRISIRSEDVLHSIISLIGENIGSIASTTAKIHDVKFIIYCGGFTIQNSMLNSILKIISKLNKLRPIFPKNSEYCGAIGALLI